MSVHRFVYQVFPPSSNQIYWGMKKAITKKAAKYKADFKRFMAQNYGQYMQPGFFDAERTYAIHLHFYFPTIVNETWGNPRARKQAKDRYKRFDLDNRVKLITDCIVEFLAVDDSHFLASSQEKHQDSNDPRIEIFVQDIDPSYFGVC